MNRETFVGLVFITFLPLLAAAATNAPTSLAPPKRIVIPKLQGPVKMDGQLNEPAWSKAAEIKAFYKNEGSGPEREPTRVKLWYDDKALYIGYICQDTNIRATLTGRDKKFWEEDVVEFFAAPKQLNRYFEFEWSPLGGIFDAIITNDLGPDGVSKSFHGDWSYTAKGMESAVQIRGKLDPSAPKDKSWQVEIRLPFADMSLSTPKPKDVWRVNFYRYNFSKGLPTEQLSW
jgi:hypothetical protein